MIRSKTMSAKIAGMKPSMPLLLAMDKQLRASAFHTERYYGWNQPRGSKIFRGLVTHPRRTYHQTTLVRSYRSSAGQMRGIVTVNVECNADPPYTE